MEKIHELDTKKNVQKEEIIKENRAEEQEQETTEQDVIMDAVEVDMMKTSREAEISESKVVAVGEGKTLEKQIKQSCKQVPKTKPTVPRPFSLATEKRTSVERRRVSDGKPPKPTLTRSASLNYKNVSKPSLAAAEKKPERRAVTSTRQTSLRPQVTTNKQLLVNKKAENGWSINHKVQAQEVGRMFPEVMPRKKQEGSNKLKKSSSFKALPLPNFCHQNVSAPKKLETKKVISVTNSKPPMFGQINKQEAVTTKSKSITSNEDKAKKVLRASSFSSKETITELIKPTGSSLSTTRDIAKSDVTCA